MNRQRGFGVIAAIVILVMLAALAAAIISFSTTQQITSAQDAMSAKAWQAARAGNEWGLYKALKGEQWTTAGDTCDSAPFEPPDAQRSATLDLSADNGFHVTVFCGSQTYNEGETDTGATKKITVYRITAVACPATTCPVKDASVAGISYIERTRVVLATK